MAYSPAKLVSFVDYVDKYLDVVRSPVNHFANGDYSLRFKVTTSNAAQELLEKQVLNEVNNAVDPNAYGVYTGLTGGQQTSTYTIIYDASGKDYDLISGPYSGYLNDVAGISQADAAHATLPGYPTPHFIDGQYFTV